jgi:hypothetical protein
MSSSSRPAWARMLAELAIIVVGVLIALAVDSWNTARGEHALEHRYLQSLVADLKGDSATYANLFLPAIAQKDSALRDIAPFVRGAPIVGDTLALLDRVSLGGRLGTRARLTLARRTTFDELSVTGNLSLIRSATLRAALVDYYGGMDIQADRLLSRIGGYPMYVHAYYPAELRDSKTEEAVRAFDVKRAVRGFRSEEFRSLLNQELNYMFLARPIFERAAAETNTTLHLVEAELPGSLDGGGS